MDLLKDWKRAVAETEIVRQRLEKLSSKTVTDLPYICLSQSEVNEGDTVVRKGIIVVEEPALVLPPNLPQFEGFEFEREFRSYLTNFFLVRGVSFPSLKYNNKMYSLDLFGGNIEKAIAHYRNRLEKEEDVRTGLIVGPGEVWQLSLLVFVCSQVIRSADNDIKRLLEDLKKEQLG